MLDYVTNATGDSGLPSEGTLNPFLSLNKKLIPTGLKKER